jgi:CubicO group peptidase (beta-lactamase class C family)
MTPAARIARGEGARGLDFSGVDATIDDAVAAGRVPGLVAAISDRRGVIYRRAAGLAAAREGERMRLDSVFRIASMTKLVTTVAVLMLHEQGRCSLDDPLAAHLPGWSQPGVLASFDRASGTYALREAASSVTIRQLLTHTSGYGYWFIEPELLRAANGVVDYSDGPFLMHDPGARFTYGLGTDVLGRIVEPLSGLPLGRFVAERIAAPLGMRATGWETPADRTRLTGVHKRAADGGFAQAPKETAGDAPHGGGGLYSTADDYLALLRLMLNEGVADDGRRLLEPRSVESIGANQIGALVAASPKPVHRARSLDFAFLDGSQNFGFNVMLETRPRPWGRPAGAYGWAGIYNTYYWVDPLAGFGAVLLMQVSPFCDPGCLEAFESFERAAYASWPIRRLRHSASSSNASAVAAP